MTLIVKDYFELADRYNVTNAKVYDMESSIKASKYPMAIDTEAMTGDIVERTRRLGSSRKGEGHDQFLTGIIVNFDLTFSNKGWVELERYRFMNFVSSQSTMHRITRFEFDAQCNEYVHEGVREILKGLIEEYNANPSPEKYLEILNSNPAGFQLTARLTTNYRQLKTIYAQRQNHRLPEWRTFCQWIEELPYFKELTMHSVKEG